MSEIGYAKRGGQTGVLVTVEEMRVLSKERGCAFIDEMVPLPDGNAPVCAEHSGFEGTVYWECEDGSHGWCCGKCGKVIQWG